MNFFGSNDFAWIEETNMKPYEDYKVRVQCSYNFLCGTGRYNVNSIFIILESVFRI